MQRRACRDFYSYGVEWRRRPAEATILTSAASLAVYNVLEDRLDHRFDLAISIRDAGRCTVLDAASMAAGHIYAHARAYA